MLRAASTSRLIEKNPEVPVCSQGTARKSTTSICSAGETPPPCRFWARISTANTQEFSAEFLLSLYAQNCFLSFEIVQFSEAMQLNAWRKW
jgi:hypothetical protein